MAVVVADSPGLSSLILSMITIAVIKWVLSIVVVVLLIVIVMVVGVSALWRGWLLRVQLGDKGFYGTSEEK